MHDIVCEDLFVSHDLSIGQRNCFLGQTKFILANVAKYKMNVCMDGRYLHICARECAPNFTFICTRAHKKKLNKRVYRFAEIY